MASAKRRLHTEEQSQHKHQRTIMGSALSLRGEVEGRVSVGPLRRSTKCIILGNDFPSWILVVGRLGFKLEHVLLKNPTYAPLAQKLVPPETIVSVANNWGAANLPYSWPGLEALCFLDGQVTESVLLLLSRLGIEEVVSTQRPRCSYAGWHQVTIVVPHTDVGGVTLRETVVIRHTKEVIDGLPRPLPHHIQRDASTVLSQSFFGRHFRVAPASTMVQPLQCRNLGTQEDPFFHGYGWLPACLNRSVRVLLPSINSPKFGGRWALRTINDSEILMSLDVSAQTACTMLQSPLNDSFYKGLLPCKCLVEGFRVLFNGGVGKDGWSRMLQRQIWLNPLAPLLNFPP